MELILHIGQSKTGTTALQSALSNNRENLLEKGVLYPDVFLKGMPLNILNHNAFVNSLNDILFHPCLSGEEYWQQFMEQFKKAGSKKMLLSGESFFGGSPYVWDLSGPQDYYMFYKRKVEKFKRFAKHFNIKIILYLRHQDEWLQSGIPQIIKYEGTTGLRIYKNDMQMSDLLSPQMDYLKLIDIWSDVLEPEAIILREYNRNSLIDNDIVSDFLTQIDVKRDGFVPANKNDDVNDSWSREFIEVKKILNELPKHKVKERTIIDIINKLDQKHGSREKYTISEEMKNQILDRFLESNQTLATRYNGGKVVLNSKAHATTDIIPVSDQAVKEAMAIFKKHYSSWDGRKCLLLNAAKHYLKAMSPFLYSFCGRQWRKMKK